MTRTWAVTFVGAIAVLGVSQANADLTLMAAPDISGSFMGFKYDPGTDHLDIDGWAAQFKPDTSTSIPVIMPLNPTFLIDATVSNLGIASAGSIAISSNLDTGGPNPPISLTGTLTAFAVRSGNSGLDFFFNVDSVSSSLASYFPVNSKIGVVFTFQGYSFPGFGGSDALDGGFNNVADLGVVPAPGAAALVAVGLTLIGWARRRCC